ncbi:vitellogenin receptor [Onthophagus taurus]|uniref:vitellogenin receptor n=1 Tax=Onthophagus taurus TaxID=166361 RepID=UPI0039BE0F4E
MYLNYFIFAYGITTSYAFLDSLYMQLEYNCTGTDNFVCQNSRCVPINKRCDGVNDCFDNSDERDCDQYQCKPPLYFKCKNNKCIPASFHCDKENDCGDYSDEIGCADFQALMAHPTNCTDEEWTCHDKLCIPKDWVCNGEPDCLDESDETFGCTDHHKCTDFQCKDGHCIPHAWVCDGSFDCSDHEDEQNCEKQIDPNECTLDERRYLCPDNKTCIRLNQLCDTKKDCPDGIDESPSCLLRPCTNTTCSHECANLPEGPKCLCPKGYHRVTDRQCEDIDECETFGICDQKCRNLPGSYRCYCDSKYKLQDDKKTCRISGGEAVLVYSSKREVRGYFLESQHLFEVARNLKQALGVAFDGRHVYWTEIASSHESIVRSLEDGDHRETLVTSGLGAAEDLALDWVTGNIYFTDSEMQHIGVCTKNGHHCTVIVNKDIHKPRGIALNPTDGEMYWSDWGDKPEIAKSLMDGTNDNTFISTDISWPNGLSLDQPNGRLYWTDAKKMTLESIRLDGTDRQVILEGIVKHPYSIAIFEDKLFWSDWTTKSIHHCNKFTGKNFHTIIKENKNEIYGINIYHAAMKTNKTNPCLSAICSDMCLLSGNGYSCACPQDKILGNDKHICAPVEKQQILIAATKKQLVQIEHKILGRHNTMPIPIMAMDITSFTYASFFHTLYISDNSTNSIISLNLNTKETKTFYKFETPTFINSMVYDYLGQNLFFCDSTHKTLNVLNLNTKVMKPLVHDFGGDVPQSVAVVPDDGLIFVAFKKDWNKYHIDRFRVDGTSRIHIAEENIKGTISLYYDQDFHRILWTDFTRGTIDSIGVDGENRHTLLFLTTYPVGITSLARDLFWTNDGSSDLMWVDKLKLDFPKKIHLDIDSSSPISLISATPRAMQPHACQYKNGNCSHICLASHRDSFQCVCPIGMNLHTDNKTCVQPLQCSSQQFHCRKDDRCIPLSMYCNGRKDCVSGEDESEDCNKRHDCPINYFQCGDGACIKPKQVCDKHYDCQDRSDERSDVCQKWMAKKGRFCNTHEFMCKNEICLDNVFVCDGVKHCEGGEDEENCLKSTCAPDEFKCNSGSCIPKRWECDRDYDCPDMSDEHSKCDYKMECTKNDYKCRNGKCIPKSLRCDKTDDCGDYSDEIDCHHQKQNECETGSYSCITNTSICIPLTSVCDGKPDCPHKEDEVQCGNCHLDQYECKNKKCINRMWICDGHDDCGDASDENNDLCTQNGTGPTGRIWAECDGYRCKNGNCIPMEQVCDKKNDCFDGSDENGMCEKSCQSDSNPCSMKCIKTPAGATCACEDGFKLEADGQSCSDIQECRLDPPVCSQLCTELMGSHTCGCYEGFALRGDKKSCKSDGEPPQIFFSVENQIRRLSVGQNRLDIPFDERNLGISGLDVAVNKNFLYFSLKYSPYIHRMDVKTGDYNSGTMQLPGNTRNLAVDWVSDNIYFVHGYKYDKKITVCSFTMRSCVDIINIDGGDNVQIESLVIDPINHVLFYTITKWSMMDHVQSVIYKSTLDGSKVFPIITAENKQISGLTLNVYSKTLYYSDRFIGDIIKSDYNGLNSFTVFRNRSHPYKMELFEDSLYFIESQGHMVSCKLYHDRSCKTVKMISFTSAHFVIFQESRQPKGINWCENHNCSYLCVPADAGPICLCPDGSIEKERCDMKGEYIASRQQMISMQFGSEKSLSNGVVALIVIFTIIAISGVLYGGYYCQQKRKHTGSFPIPNWSSVEYTNPIYGKQRNDLLQSERGESGNPVDFGSKDMEAAANAILDRVNPLVDVSD